MSRDGILGTLRTSLCARADDPERAAAVTARLAGERPSHVVPARAEGLSGPERVDLFLKLAAMNGATIARVADPDDVPGAISDYLAQNNLPARLRLSPDPWLAGLPWEVRPMLEISEGAARPDDPTGVTPCFAAIAETGTLMLLSGLHNPTTLNFLPETHIVVARAGQVVGPFDEALTRLRARKPDFMPRTVNFITGPSRTADIEQTMYMGAHGPKRLHIVLVDDADGAG